MKKCSAIFLNYMKKHLENEEKLFKTVNTFKAISIRHNKQTDGVSCGLHVIELQMK